MAVPPGPGKPKVTFAVYGALVGGNSDNAKAADVTDALQKAINNTDGEVVKIDNKNLGPDPAKGTQKHFGAIVVLASGKSKAFACLENQTIDFT
jgi:hypothetical protein